MFKPQNTYEGTFMERFQDIPDTALDLLKTLLSMDPHERGTASSALMSEVDSCQILLSAFPPLSIIYWRHVFLSYRFLH